MPTTLTYGRKVPLDGEKGTWWDNIEANIAIDDAHTHDNVTSPPISTRHLTKGTSSIVAASWSAVSGQAGTFRQSVTVPTGYSTTSACMTFYVASGAETGSQIFPSIERINSTSYYIYINDNSLDVTAVYA